MYLIAHQISIGKTILLPNILRILVKSYSTNIPADTSVGNNVSGKEEAILELLRETQIKLNGIDVASFKTKHEIIRAMNTLKHESVREVLPSESLGRIDEAIFTLSHASQISNTSSVVHYAQYVANVLGEVISGIGG